VEYFNAQDRHCEVKVNFYVCKLNIVCYLVAYKTNYNYPIFYLPHAV